MTPLGRPGNVPSSGGAKSGDEESDGGDAGGKRDADFFDRMTRAKSESGETPPGGREAHNDNTPFDEKAWRRKYMREYMAKKRARMKDQQSKGQAG